MTETATFAAGCFWGVEVTFRNVEGVLDAVVGYTGGHTQNPTCRVTKSMVGALPPGRALG